MTKWLKSKSAIFILAFLLRMGLSWDVLRTIPMTDFWRASEPGAVAQSILEGRGFVSPYDKGQPSAWIAPIYPVGVVVPVFSAFGAYSFRSTFVLVALNALLASIAALVIFAVGTRAFGVATGATAAWLWAACVPNAVVPVLIWDTSLSTLLLSLGMLLTLILEGSSSYVKWGSNGLFWGCVCLVNPSLISPAPFLAFELWLRERAHGANVWRQVALSILLAVVVVSPWLVRNYRVFGRPVFVRSNFSAELYFGNLGFKSHPLGPTLEYQQLGEIPYIALKQRLVGEYIRTNFHDFIRHSLRRVILFWSVPKITGLYWPVVSVLSFVGIGLAMHERSSSALLFLIILVVYPLPYYVSYVFEKYRHPIEPLMFVLAAYPLVRAAQLARGQLRLRKVLDEGLQKQ